MDPQHRKELIQSYKAAPTYYGVIQITNQINGKIFIDTVANLHNRWYFYQTNLNKNFYRHTRLQADWNEYGADNFNFEVLWQKETTDVENMHTTLKQLKRTWFDKCQPFGERGYNDPLKED